MGVLGDVRWEWISISGIYKSNPEDAPVVIAVCWR